SLQSDVDPISRAERVTQPRTPARARERGILKLLVQRGLEPERQPEHERLRVARAEIRAAGAARLPAQRRRARGAEQVAQLEVREADDVALALHARRALEPIVAGLLDLISERAGLPLRPALEAGELRAREHAELGEPRGGAGRHRGVVRLAVEPPERAFGHVPARRL